MVLPALLGWMSLVFLFVVSAWLSDNFPSQILRIFIVLAWLLAIPMSGFVMGTLSATLWHQAELTLKEHHKWSSVTLWLYGVPLLLVSILFLQWFVVVLLLPAVFHINNYFFAQQWMNECRFEEYFDLSDSSTKS